MLVHLEPSKRLNTLQCHLKWPLIAQVEDILAAFHVEFPWLCLYTENRQILLVLVHHTGEV